MKTAALVTLASLLFTPYLSNAGQSPIDELCKQVSCREDTHVFLALNPKDHWEGTFPKSPYVINENLVNIIPGETLYLTGVSVEGVLKNIKVSKAKPAEEIAIEISFQQETEEKNHKQMVLTVNNPHDKILKYSAAMLPLGEQKMYRTSTCPVIPGLSSHESWSQPILRLILEDFQFIENDSEVPIECK